MVIDGAGSAVDSRRIVLVVPSDGYRAAAFLDAAAALDADVVIATEETPPLAAGMEDRLVVVDLERPESSAAGIVALAQRRPIDAVVGIDDRGVLLAAHASELLDLPHNPPDAVAATRNKIDMRSVFAAWAVPQPAYRVLPPGDDVAALVAEVGLPCVLKPVSMSASTGVIRVDTAAEAVAAEGRIRGILTAHGHSADEPLLVEQFVAGVEVSVEGLLRDGDLEVLALFDKPDRLDGPYFEETLYVTPSRLAAAVQEAVLEATAAGCRALGLRDGPVHAELRVADERTDGLPDVRVLEIAARSIGGRCSKALRFGAGMSLEELIVRDALRLGVDSLGRSDRSSGVLMVPIHRSGILVDVTGIDAARAVPGVIEVEITAVRGRRIEALPEGARYLGFVFASGDAPEVVEASLRAAQAELDVVIVGEPGATGP